MRLARWPTVFGLLVSWCWGCADIAGLDGNPQMDPGQDCLTCHSANGPASSLGFSVAGTVYPAALAGAKGGLFDAEVDIIDLNGRQLALRTNGAGNFYSAEAIAFPAAVSVKVGAQWFSMQKQAPTGQCNVCHAVLANADGTLRPAPIPAFLADAGFPQPAPGRLYGYAGSECSAPSELLHAARAELRGSGGTDHPEQLSGMPRPAAAQQSVARQPRRHRGHWNQQQRPGRGLPHAPARRWRLVSDEP